MKARIVPWNIYQVDFDCREFRLLGWRGAVLIPFSSALGQQLLDQMWAEKEREIARAERRVYA